MYMAIFKGFEIADFAPLFLESVGCPAVYGTEINTKIQISAWALASLFRLSERKQYVSYAHEVIESIDHMNTCCTDLL